MDNTHEHDNEHHHEPPAFARRTLLRVGAVGAAGAGLTAAGALAGPSLARRGLLTRTASSRPPNGAG